MAYEMSMGDDGILRVVIIGDMGDEEVESYIEDIRPFLEAATEAEPLRSLTDGSRMGKVSVAVRKKFIELVSDPRQGKAATVGANRYIRVLGSFLMKAIGRDNIRYFDSEEEALAWLKGES